MKNITSEKIDNIIDKVFNEQTENTLNDFIDNYQKYKRAFDEIVRDSAPNAPSDYAERFSGECSDAFASIKTAQDNFVIILKETLKELLCEE